MPPSPVLLAVIDFGNVEDDADGGCRKTIGAKISTNNHTRSCLKIIQNNNNNKCKAVIIKGVVPVVLEAIIIIIVD